jgi:hypothetical protein
MEFDRSIVLRSCGQIAKIEGREYPYVFLPGRGHSLCVHFSAFFGEWGEQREWRAQFAGWFHRLRMFWPDSDRNFLFLCDTYGADDNGTYYKGIAGDWFVERAMDQIQADVAHGIGVSSDQTVALGSSMGATAALRFALRHRYAGAVAIAPHIALDISAQTQGRQRHVAAVLGSDDVDAAKFRPVTREIEGLVHERSGTLPRLVIQSMLDDHGVHAEQVLPLVTDWRSGGGAVVTDYHERGGHTSEFATADFFSRSIAWCLDGSATRAGGEQEPAGS